jgi:selenide,water dikinase
MDFISTCTSGGCGAKIDAGTLASLLAGIPVRDDPALLSGFGGNEDAAVYELPGTGGQCLVSTADFFPPMVSDPFLFGKIAAANALSDVYAMGGTPRLALNLVCFPEKMDLTFLRRMLAGGAEKAAEAGVTIAGGHSIYDSSVKYGLSVTGFLRKADLLRNNTCREGDALVLTKPLGVGLILSAQRAGDVRPADVRGAERSMERLNRYAAEKMLAINGGSDGDRPIHACTDVTGFGLLAHAAEMAGDDRTLLINGDSLPILPGAAEAAKNFYATAGGQRNRNHLAGDGHGVPAVSTKGCPAWLEEVCYDPQTSGGLLIAVTASRADELCTAIRSGQNGDPSAAIIGAVERKDKDGYKVGLL